MRDVGCTATTRNAYHAPSLTQPVTPHHSTFRNPYPVSIPHSAFRIPHLLERFVNRAAQVGTEGAVVAEVDALVGALDAGAVADQAAGEDRSA